MKKVPVLFCAAALAVSAALFAAERSSVPERYTWNQQDLYATKAAWEVDRDAYLKMLSGGSSKYPIDLLIDAGVDTTTSAPLNAAIAETNAITDQMEVILAKPAKKGK